MSGSSSFDRSAHPRVPVAGEVWVNRHLGRHGRGHVVIEDPPAGRSPSADLCRHVWFRYMGSGTVNDGSVSAFTAIYVFAADSVDRLQESEFPRRGSPSRRPFEIAIGTAVTS